MVTLLTLVTLVPYASVMISYIFSFHSGKFAVLPTHDGLASDKLVPAVVLAIHYIQVAWKLYAVALACMPVVMWQVSQLGNSELGFYFQVFQVLSLLLLSLYIQSEVVVEIYMLCGVVVALDGCLPV